MAASSSSAATTSSSSSSSDATSSDLSPRRYRLHRRRPRDKHRDRDERKVSKKSHHRSSRTKRRRRRYTSPDRSFLSSSDDDYRIIALKRGGSSKRPKSARDEDASVPTTSPRVYLNAEAEKIAPFVRKRAIVPERGLVVEDFLVEYVATAAWRQFIKEPEHGGDRDLTHEFYTNLAAVPAAVPPAVPAASVYLRGQQVSIAAADINRYYGLPNYPEDPYQRLLQDGIDLDDLTFILTGESRSLLPTWRHLKKEMLVREARVWYYFVASRLMPTVTNSEVRKERAFLTYAIMKGIRIDVGRVIYREIMASLESRRSQWSLGFPALIYGLSRAAGIRVTSRTESRIPSRKIISLQLIDIGSRGRRKPIPRPQPEISEDEVVREEEQRGQTSIDPTFGDRLSSLERSVEDLKLHMTTELVATQRIITAGFEALQQSIEAQFAAHFPRPPPHE